MTSDTETKTQNNHAVDNVAKEKKKTTRLSKEKKPKTTKTAPHHPPYFQMIKEALVALNEKKGSSPHAIAKYMEEKHKDVLPENFKKMLTLQLKNSASKGKLTKVKASYKLSDQSTTITSKKVIKPAASTDHGAKNKPKYKRLSANAATEPQKGTGTVKKQAGVVKKAKKMTTAKPKQAKSIKSPAAKKARKAAASV